LAGAWFNILPLADGDSSLLKVIKGIVGDDGIGDVIKKNGGRGTGFWQ